MLILKKKKISKTSLFYLRLCLGKNGAKLFHSLFDLELCVLGLENQIWQISFIKLSVLSFYMYSETPLSPALFSVCVDTKCMHWTHLVDESVQFWSISNVLLLKCLLLLKKCVFLVWERYRTKLSTFYSDAPSTARLCL